MSSESDEFVYDPDAPLSSLRQKILYNLLPAVIPSQHPDARFNRISFGEQIDLEKIWLSLPTYTTCVLLPGYIGAQFGVSGLAGLDNIRTAGWAKNAWVQYYSHIPRLPLPGDMYALFASGNSNPFDGLIAHVGVVVKILGNSWRTADAGQGSRPVQKADYVNRRFNAAAGTLTEETIKSYSTRPPRQLAGWLDVDKFFAPKRAFNGPGRLPRSVHARA